MLISVCAHKLGESYKISMPESVARDPCSSLVLCSTSTCRHGEMCGRHVLSHVTCKAPPRSSSLRIVAFIFMINIKGNKKMFYREMSLWATRKGFTVSVDQEWFMSRSGAPRGYMNYQCAMGDMLHCKIKSCS